MGESRTPGPEPLRLGRRKSRVSEYPGDIGGAPYKSSPGRNPLCTITPWMPLGSSVREQASAPPKERKPEPARSPKTVLPQTPQQRLQPRLAVLIHRRTHPPRRMVPHPKAQDHRDPGKSYDKSTTPPQGRWYDPGRSARRYSVASR